MKPNFALGLTVDGITLWQRADEGWLRVGAVNPEAADMDAQMRGLAKVAAALAPEGVRTKLIVPDDQILFFDADITARRREMQAHDIRAQLAGRTPYPVEELDFDWPEVEGGAARVAVVARETLVEAEDFAAHYGLNPICAVSAGQNDSFKGEAFFGPTRSARTLIGDVSLIERDGSAVNEIGLATLPEPELLPEKLTDLVAPQEDATPPVAEPEPKAKPEPEPAAKPQERAPETAAPDKSVTAEASPAVATETPAPSAKPDVKPETSAPAETSVQAPQPPAKEARNAALLARLKASAQSPETAAAGASSEPAEPVAFKSRRVTAPAPLPASSTKLPPRKGAPESETPAGANPVPTSAPSQSPAKDLLGGLRGKLGAVPELSKRSKQSVEKAMTVAKAIIPAKKVVAPAATIATAGTQALAEKVAKPVTPASSTLVDRKDPLETLRSRGGSKPPRDEAEQLTIFGARNSELYAPSPMPRILLVLGGIGLLLAAIAIWVVFFTRTAPDQVEVASDPVMEEIVPPLPGDLSFAEDQAFMEAEIEAALGLEDAAERVPLDAPFPEDAATDTAPLAPETVPDQSQGPALIEDEPARQAEAQPAPSAAGQVAGIRSTALMAPQVASPLPEAPAPPRPFAEESQAPLATAEESPEALVPEELAEGLAEAAPAGEEDVEITVTEGTPPLTPPARPDGIAPEQESAAEAVETEVEDLAEDIAAAIAQATPDTPVADTPLDALDESAVVVTVTETRPPVAPPVRPEGLAPEAAATDLDQDDAALQSVPGEDVEPVVQAALDTSDLAPPPGGVALSALRPQSRPSDFVPTVTPEAPQIEGTALAVAASLRPSNRPGQFATIVQRALRAAQPRATTPTPPAAALQQTAVAAAAPAPAAMAAPSAPAIPASASVAREATVNRAINLRQINLIGVMGTPQARRALVRLSNGRVVTVRVGEQLDSGQVTAISDTELRYTRRGRDVVLRLPG